MSESNRVRVIYVPEVTYGTTPADDPGWKTARLTSESLTGTPRKTISQEIRSDRMDADLIRTGLDVGGAINFELSAASFDDFIEAAMCDDWTTDVLNVGLLDKSFSIEKEFQDLTNQFQLFTGMRVGSMELNFEFGAIVTGTFNFAGNGVTTPATSAVGTGSIAAAGTDPVMDASAGITALQIDAGTPGFEVRRIGLNLNNQMRPIEGVGNLAPANQRKGSARISGTLSAYLADLDLYDKVVDNTVLSLDWTVSDGSKSFQFFVPKAKLREGPPVAGGRDQDILPDYTWEALYDSVTGTSMRITRVP